MVIGIDAREICDKPAGKGQYLLRLLFHWQRTPGYELILYTYPGQVLPASVEGPSVHQCAVGGRAVFWHRAVGRRGREDSIDVFFAALTYQSALWNRVPTVTVVHDLAVFRLPRLAHRRKSVIVERLALRRSLAVSAEILVLSQSTKRDLTELMDADPNKITVIPGAPLLTSARVPPIPHERREPYFLFMGTLEPRKNIATVLRAYAALAPGTKSRYRLKLVGKPGWGGEDYSAIARELEIESDVDFLGYVSDAELEHLLRHAMALVYPSFYEGFGLPVVEAMAVGTPVITSNTSSLPEIVGSEGFVFAPDDATSMAACLARLIEDKEFFDHQSAYLARRAQEFDWKTAANETLELLGRATRFIGYSKTSSIE
jgi:glycosyltransferase involved in cell wall biosynthesis